MLISNKKLNATKLPNFRSDHVDSIQFGLVVPISAQESFHSSSTHSFDTNDNTTNMSSRYLMLIGAIPVCYFAGYAYREYNDPDQTMTVKCMSAIKNELPKNRGKIHLSDRRKED